MRKEQPLRIAQHSDSLGKVVEESSRRSRHVDCVQKAQADQRRIGSKYFFVLARDSGVIASVVVVVVVVSVVNVVKFESEHVGVLSFVFVVAVVFFFFVVVVVVVVVDSFAAEE